MVRRNRRLPTLTYCELRSSNSQPSSPVPPFWPIRTPMPKPGRPPWTTPDQHKYLEKYLPDLDDEKANNGLTQLYARITRDFSKIWEPPIVEKDREAAKNADDLKKFAYERRGRVSRSSSILCKPPLTVTATANFRVVQKAPQKHHHFFSAQARPRPNRAKQQEASSFAAAPSVLRSIPPTGRVATTRRSGSSVGTPSRPRSH